MWGPSDAVEGWEASTSSTFEMQRNRDRGGRWGRRRGPSQARARHRGRQTGALAESEPHSEPIRLVSSRFFTVKMESLSAGERVESGDSSRLRTEGSPHH